MRKDGQVAACYDKRKKCTSTISNRYHAIHMKHLASETLCATLSCSQEKKKRMNECMHFSVILIG